jgi:hypothetical protein
MSEKPAKGVKAKIHHRAEKYSVTDTLKRQGGVIKKQGAVLVDVGADIASGAIKVGEKVADVVKEKKSKRRKR